MSFLEYETSLQNGKPIRLYQFQRGPLRWGYTSADRDISHLSINFRSIEGGILDDGIRQTNDAQADTLNLTVSAKLDIAQMYRVIAPSQTIKVSIFDLHYGDSDYLLVWVGQIAGVKFKDQFTAQIQCQTLAATLERTGLRKTWARNCAHTLYDTDCRVERAAHKLEGFIDRIDGASIGFANASAKVDGYYSGGYIEWSSQYGLEQRGIEAHQNDLLTIYGGTHGLANGQSLKVFAGCDRTLTTCNTKFNNVLNYGGCAHMPGKSPFDGTPVF